MVVDSEWKPLYKPVKHCERCEAGLYEGDWYFDIDGLCICDECIRDYLTTNYRRMV